MLIIPISRSLDWRRPPLVTLLLILVNTLIFFGLQSGDEKRAAVAYRYYVASSLPQTELPRYVKHLEASGRTREAAEASSALNSRRWALSLLACISGPSLFMPSRVSEV